jgi:hypothetical protein
MSDKWKKVAEVLASRLVMHAFCREHKADSPDPDCPFCEDRQAYSAYLKAGGRDFRPPPHTGPVVSVDELHRRALLGSEERSDGDRI